MTANKMPEMPFSPYLVSEWTGPEMIDRKSWTAYTADQMRAMYLAGLEAAKACVPDTDPFSGGADRDKDSQVTGQIHFRHAVLTNLTALEQEAKK